MTTKSRPDPETCEVCDRTAARRHPCRFGRACACRYGIPCEPAGARYDSRRRPAAAAVPLP